MYIKTNCEPLKPGNPFLSDGFNMGSQIGKNVHVMYANHPDEKCEYLYVVDTETGERIKVMF